LVFFVHFPAKLIVKRVQVLLALPLELNILLVQLGVENFVLYDGFGLWQVSDRVDILVCFEGGLGRCIDGCYLFARFFLLFL
ncbi:MAG: hypothetical protein ACK559_33210, partial [bacterium]